jgi:hypothetical protein
MRRNKGGWWVFILTLVVLLAPLSAHADFWPRIYGGGGGDPSGDPDQPTGPNGDNISPGNRLSRAPGNGDLHSPSSPIQRARVNRYLTLLSGLRSYYLHF